MASMVMTRVDSALALSYAIALWCSDTIAHSDSGNVLLNHFSATSNCPCSLLSNGLSSFFPLFASKIIPKPSSKVLDQVKRFLIDGKGIEEFDRKTIGMESKNYKEFELSVEWLGTALGFESKQIGRASCRERV